MGLFTIKPIIATYTANLFILFLNFFELTWTHFQNKVPYLKLKDY